MTCIEVNFPDFRNTAMVHECRATTNSDETFVPRMTTYYPHTKNVKQNMDTNSLEATLEQ